jgi:YHS domain-containing protein
MFLRRAVLIFLSPVVVWLAGCATQQPSPAADARPMVTCYVCDYNNDLGCVCFRLKESTPRVTFEGKEYFFCSDDCYQAFLRKPAKYAAHHGSK